MNFPLFILIIALLTIIQIAALGDLIIVIDFSWNCNLHLLLNTFWTKKYF